MVAKRKKLLGFINHCTAFPCRIPEYWSLSPMGIVPRAWMTGAKGCIITGEEHEV